MPTQKFRVTSNHTHRHWHWLRLPRESTCGREWQKVAVRPVQNDVNTVEAPAGSRGTVNLKVRLFSLEVDF